jgi:hypothetical protein
LFSVTAEPSAPSENLDNNGCCCSTTTTTTTTTRLQTSTPPPPSYRNFTPADNQGGQNSAPTNDHHHQQMQDPAEHDRMVASGTAGAVIGLLVGGPFLAVIAGFGSAYATQKDGVAGDTTRALGDVALAVKEKARELNSKHHMVDKSKKVAEKVWGKAQDLDRKHHILQQFKALFLFSWRALGDFVRRHRLLEKGVDGVGRGLEYVAGRVVSSGGGAGTAEGTRSTSSPDENSTFTNNERRSETRQM